ncbi:hypothetical protein [Candidatus Phyllobacterium onerii]|uniref:hypothetical protein n=1 Tax=Candidatus Phyllobacterium onerii TaxID=3020828 RepID=UPI002330B7A0|nr:hypothetical protein [Phyllobacterium sp. IY22]
MTAADVDGAGGAETNADDTAPETMGPIADGLPASPATPSALTSSCPTWRARRFSHACRALRSKPWRKLPHQAQGHPLGGRRSGEQRR